MKYRTAIIFGACIFEQVLSGHEHEADGPILLYTTPRLCFGISSVTNRQIKGKSSILNCFSLEFSYN